MSSLAAARADNFYYPPEWTPSHGSLNKFHGQHALRDRAKKIHHGILVIRFEMPFNVWCGGCGSMIAKGVRFNAEKKQIGNYFSTKIWSFIMKTACCRHEIEIHTDPKCCEYVVISGAEKKIEAYDAADAETILLPSVEDREKLLDPFFHLEHVEGDIQKGKEEERILMLLQKESDIKHSDYYASNKALRSQLRAQKKRVAEETAYARKLGLGIRLLPASQEDSKEAAKVCFAKRLEINRRNKRAAIIAAPIFSGNEKSHLLAKRMRIDAAAVHNLVSGNFKLSKPSI